MLHGPPNLSSTEEAEYYYQELRAQRLRAKQLFHCYLGDDDPIEEVEDDYYPYFEEGAR